MVEQYYDMFKEIYNSDIRSYGVSIDVSPNIHIFEFDVNKGILLIDSKFKRTPNIIKVSLQNKCLMLTKMINMKTLKPFPKINKLFDALFPTYAVKILGNVALAKGVEDHLMCFLKEGNQFNKPILLIDKEQTHRTLRHYVLPLVYNKSAVKPQEYMSDRTAVYANKINDALSELGHHDKYIFATKNGVILDCGEKSPVVICLHGGTAKRGDKNSHVYKELLLMQKLSK